SVAPRCQRLIGRLVRWRRREWLSRLDLWFCLGDGHDCLMRRLHGGASCALAPPGPSGGGNSLGALCQEAVGLLCGGIELLLNRRRAVGLTAEAGCGVEDVPERALVGVLHLSPLRNRSV